ncbi:hypothetical protein [Thioalkalivibrio sp. ALE19]|nr:hypothetical protein [Thioalkalivibrio sp. ALE19]
MFYITYRNQGKKEKTPSKFETRESAKKVADFLKIQGATSVRVMRA